MKDWYYRNYNIIQYLRYYIINPILIVVSIWKYFVLPAILLGILDSAVNGNNILYGFLSYFTMLVKSSFIVLAICETVGLVCVFLYTLHLLNIITIERTFGLAVFVMTTELAAASDAIRRANKAAEKVGKRKLRKLKRKSERMEKTDTT